MMRFLKAAILTTIILFPLFAYTYAKGMADGVERYRHSREFRLTMLSMYRFGLIDGCTDWKTCQKAGLEDADEDERR